MMPSRRVPGTIATDYVPYAKLLWAGKHQAIGQLLACKGTLWEKLMQPFLLAALNTEPKESSAALAGAILRETFAKGGQACRPRIATPTLAAAFIDPALNFLKAHGADVRLGTRLRAITFGAGTAAALEFPDVTIPLGPKDLVVLAVPPWVAQDLVPGLTAPDDFRAIVNAHFKIPAPKDAPPILGVIGGTAEWIFSFPDRISVTVSGADAIVDRGPGRSGANAVGRCRRGAEDCGAPAHMADREGKARHLCRHPGAGCQTASRPDPLDQSAAGRRLDPDRPARHHRRGAAFGRNRGGFGAAATVFIVCP